MRGKVQWGFARQTPIGASAPSTFNTNALDVTTESSTPMKRHNHTDEKSKKTRSCRAASPVYRRNSNAKFVMDGPRIGCREFKMSIGKIRVIVLSMFLPSQRI